MSQIGIAMSDEQIERCYPVLVQLRPHLRSEEFVDRIRQQMKDGYQLAFLESGGAIKAVAGFRVGSNLAWGKFIYVDDLVTDQRHRSQGLGKTLLDWLRDEAGRRGCRQLHLDSGLQRWDAHRFYEREGMAKTGYHFMVGME